MCSCSWRAFKTSGGVACSSTPTFLDTWDPSGTSSRGCVSLPTVEHFCCLDTWHVASNRVCNCLALIQSVATHQTSKAFLIDARIPLLLYPLLTLPGSDRASEFVRVTTLGMIGSLVKEGDSQSVFFLVKSELIPLCLRIMGNANSTDRARTAAAWVVQKLLLNDFGSIFFCLFFLDLASSFWKHFKPCHSLNLLVLDTFWWTWFSEPCATFCPTFLASILFNLVPSFLYINNI